MRKFFRSSKIFKIISLVLIMAFSVNLAGCKHENSVISNQNGGGNKNYKVGIGNDITGYSIYSQSTFDPMTKELFMGYLLNGRNFTLVVVPGRESDDDDNPYEIINPEENYLFTSAQAGIYKYNDLSGTYENPEVKALMYYVTDKELVNWFNEFEEDDNFLSKAVEFASASVDIEKPSRYKCSILVNMGSGLNATDFCGTYSEANSSLFGGIITNSKAITYSNGSTYYPFSDSVTGGMILFFGYNSIQGYMTYHHINEYTGSKIANSFDEADCVYHTGASKFNYGKMLESVRESLISDGLYTEASLINYNTDQALQSDIISYYMEKEMIGVTGCDKFKKTHLFLEQALLTDNNYSSLNTLRDFVENKLNTPNLSAEDGDKYNALKEIITMLSPSSFNSNKKKEAFSIKLSSSLYSRYSSVNNVSDTSILNSGLSITSVEDGNGNGVAYSKIKELVAGINNASDDYLVLVTADGFIHDRGDEEDQVLNGAGELLGYSAIMQELIKMDACPNKTIAADVFNMLLNLKIVAGTALVVTGLTTAAVAGIGLAVASVINKLALVTSVAPVPGARIAALILVGIAGLITLGAGIFTLYSGLKDRARLKGMGASEENYCSTYKATFKSLFETISLTVPVYHYNIAKDNDDDGEDAISLNYCSGSDIYNSEKHVCQKYGEDNKEEIIEEYSPFSIPMYYYADREQARELNLKGMPILMFYSNGKLLDSIYGATTPSFIVEALRFWGILAMREIVYKGYLENKGNTINIYHTTNTNSRTMKVSEARYCYTFDYELNLYGNIDNDFCYFNNNAYGYSNINKNWSVGDSTTTSLLTIDITNKDNLKTRLDNLYSGNGFLGYFSDLEVYGYGTVRDSYLKDLKSIQSGQILSSFIYTIGWEFENGTYTTVKYKIEENEYTLSGNVFRDGFDIYVISNGKIYLFGKSTPNNVDTYHYYGELATFIDGKDLDGLLKELDTKKYNVLEFFKFIAGKKSFDEANNVTIPLYFTTSIKEVPQANYYYDDSEKKVCDEGEYVYWRDNGIFGEKWKCLRDDKVKSKDTAKSTEQVGGEATYNYFTTSVHVGNIIISIDSKDANIKYSVEWLTENKN